MKLTERQQIATSLGMILTEYDDLQVWLRHGRIGTGRGYQQEVERAKAIDDGRAALKDKQP
jgi:hypothetical protein